mmetsp:Transcript_10073/g.17717  ORF Transcript_10073/g.17717 Transcript_10073/m.17717 type:complete len:502 (+) Transcript_10073:195-1700(+)
MEAMRSLSRFQLKRLVRVLAEKCGGEGAIQEAMKQVLVEDAKPEREKVVEADRPVVVATNKKVEDTGKGEITKLKAIAKQADQGKKKKREKKAFEMGYFAQRHIALHVAYFGEKYRGLASQENSNDTVEDHLFAALEKACLITDRASSGYSRCGRTDAGVSALGQVVSLTVRSALKNPQPAAASIAPTMERPVKKKVKQSTDENSAEVESKAATHEDDNDELDYPHILNRLLPDDIMVLGWAPLSDLDFKARFNADARTYRYYFRRKDFDLERMRQAANLLVGEHDYRNFCKMDVTNVKNFIREIKACEIVEEDGPEAGREGMCYIKVCGTAFLWHQIRCIASVLFLVARGLEDPDVVSTLLDIEKVPRKPVYHMAPGAPLILYESAYAEADVKFRYKAKILNQLRVRLEYRMTEFMLKSQMVKGVLDFVDNHAPLFDTGDEYLAKSGQMEYASTDLDPVHTKAEYVKIMDRRTCDSYEEKVQNLSEKKRETVRERHGWDL